MLHHEELGEMYCVVYKEATKGEQINLGKYENRINTRIERKQIKLEK
jgi:hypothetical protein